MSLFIPWQNKSRCPCHICLFLTNTQKETCFTIEYLKRCWLKINYQVIYINYANSSVKWFNFIAWVFRLLKCALLYTCILTCIKCHICIHIYTYISTLELQWVWKRQWIKNAIQSFEDGEHLSPYCSFSVVFSVQLFGLMLTEKEKASGWYENMKNKKDIL